MGYNIKFSIHRNPKKDADGKDTFQVRHETRGTVNSEYMARKLKEYGRMQPETLLSALIVLQDSIVQQLTDNHRVHIDGIGTFFLKLGFRERYDEDNHPYKPHFTDANAITGNDICIEGVGFTPDKEFLYKLKHEHGYYFHNVSEQGKVGRSNEYTEEQVIDFINDYLAKHVRMSRRNFMVRLGLTDYMADKWLRRLSTGDDAILIKHKIGNATFYNLRKQP